MVRGYDRVNNLEHSTWQGKDEKSYIDVAPDWTVRAHAIETKSLCDNCCDSAARSDEDIPLEDKREGEKGGGDNNEQLDLTGRASDDDQISLTA